MVAGCCNDDTLSPNRSDPTCTSYMVSGLERIRKNL
jgi:hypothetical protein